MIGSYLSLATFLEESKLQKVGPLREVYKKLHFFLRPLAVIKAMHADHAAAEEEEQHARDWPANDEIYQSLKSLLKTVSVMVDFSVTHTLYRDKFRKNTAAPERKLILLGNCHLPSVAPSATILTAAVRAYNARITELNAFYAALQAMEWYHFEPWGIVKTKSGDVVCAPSGPVGTAAEGKSKKDRVFDLDRVAWESAAREGIPPHVWKVRSLSWECSREDGRDGGFLGGI